MASLPSGWVHDVMKDIQWMALFEDFADLLQLDCNAIIAHIRLAPREFLLKTRKFFMSPFQNIDVHCTSSSKPGNGIVGRYECYECGCIQPTYQQLQLHIKTVHKFSNPIALYIDTTYCHICLTEFHTRECILNHLRYRSHACRAALLLRGPVLTISEADELSLSLREANRKLHANARRRHHKDAPSYRLEGPLPLLYYMRFGTIWHSDMKRSRPPNKNNKYSSCRKHIQNNKHGNWVYSMYFGDKADTHISSPGGVFTNEHKLVPHVPLPVANAIKRRLRGKQARPTHCPELAINNSLNSEPQFSEPAASSWENPYVQIYHNNCKMCHHNIKNTCQIEEIHSGEAIGEIVVADGSKQDCADPCAPDRWPQFSETYPIHNNVKQLSIKTHTCACNNPPKYLLPHSPNTHGAYNASLLNFAFESSGNNGSKCVSLNAQSLSSRFRSRISARVCEESIMADLCSTCGKEKRKKEYIYIYIYICVWVLYIYFG